MNDLKKVLLAGIGLTAMTVDKADSFVKELVEKGRLTVEEGKELEQELDRKSTRLNSSHMSESRMPSSA